jgi:hypothetical protein
VLFDLCRWRFGERVQHLDVSRNLEKGKSFLGPVDDFCGIQVMARLGNQEGEDVLIGEFGGNSDDRGFHDIVVTVEDKFDLE